MNKSWNFSERIIAESLMKPDYAEAPNPAL